MTRQTKLRRAGGSLAATIPKEMLDRLQLSEGDTIYVRETPEGVLLTAFDPDFDEAMRVADRGARKFRNALRELSQR